MRIAARPTSPGRPARARHRGLRSYAGLGGPVRCGRPGAALPLDGGRRAQMRYPDNRRPFGLNSRRERADIRARHPK